MYQLAYLTHDTVLRSKARLVRMNMRLQLEVMNHIQITNNATVKFLTAIGLCLARFGNR